MLMFLLSSSSSSPHHQCYLYYHRYHDRHHHYYVFLSLQLYPLQGFEESREWLVRALRCMEKLDPLPVRAMAFVQLQLSQVLNKQGAKTIFLLEVIRQFFIHSVNRDFKYYFILNGYF